MTGARVLDRPAYDAAVADLRAQLAALPADAPVRLGKSTSNLFRTRADVPQGRLDVSAFAGVLEVDPVARTADVLGMTTYEQLVDATLAHGLVPLVVPQLKTITLGGAVVGLGIESSSFRNGTPTSRSSRWTCSPARASCCSSRPTARTPTCSGGSRTATARSATPCGCGSSSSRCSRTSTCATSPAGRSTRPRRSCRPSAASGCTTASRSGSSTPSGSGLPTCG